MALNTLSSLHDTVIRGAIFNRVSATGLSAVDAVRVIAPLNKSELIVFARSNGITDDDYQRIYDNRNTLRTEWVRVVSAANTAPAPAISAPAPVDLSGIESSIAALNSRLDSVASTIPVTPKIDADAAVAAAVDKAFGKFRAIVDSVAGAPEAIADATAVRIIERKSALEVFGVDIRDRSGNPVLVDIVNDPLAPPVDDSYIFNETALRLALVAQDSANNPDPAIPPNIWLAGDRGTGKTQFATQFAARTGRAFYRINFDRHLERLDFIGGKGLVNGETVWQDGTFLIAYKRPYAVTLLDEFGFANPANIANLQALLEAKASVTYDGVTHRRALGTIVFVADNSTGNRDESGRFRGVQEQNIALLDRFPATIRFEFLPANIESGLIRKRTGCDASLADNIVHVLNVARAKTNDGEIIDAPSLRQAFALAEYITAGFDSRTAWDIAISNKSPAESRAALDAIAASFFELV